MAAYRALLALWGRLWHLLWSCGGFQVDRRHAAWIGRVGLAATSASTEASDLGRQGLGCGFGASMDFCWNSDCGLPHAAAGSSLHQIVPGALDPIRWHRTAPVWRDPSHRSLLLHSRSVGEQAVAASVDGLPV